jgi:hypothetical protein
MKDHPLNHHSSPSKALTSGQRQRTLLNEDCNSSLIPSLNTANRIFRIVLVILLGSAAANAFGQVAMQSEQASPADSFVDSIGVGTHLTYQNTLYFTAWPQVYRDLQQLGVRHIRDGYFDPNWGPPYTTVHQQLAQAHILTDYVIPFDPAITPQSIEQLASVTQDMELLEAPNECDVGGNCGVTKAESMSNMLGFLPVVQQAAGALNIPVIGPSYAAFESYPLGGNVASNITYSNLHVYFGGRYPGSTGWGGPDAKGNAYGSIPFWIDQAKIEGPGLPAVITETGYLSFPGIPIPFTIPLSVEASYIPRTFLLAYMHGIGRSYQYELLEDPTSPGYGLIDGNLNERPAFLAIQNLIANLADPGPIFMPGSLQYSLQGGDQSLNRLLFQKHDGSFWMILWLEQSSYDTVNQVPTPVIPQKVTLTLGGGYLAPNIGTFDDTGNLSWTSEQPASSVVPLMISDQPTIVKILPQ